MQDLFKLQSEGKNAPFYSFWLAAASTFFLDALFRGVQVHLAVSMVRMAGYNALRGMYKPFSANSIHEFYNRYSYYFKEVLVHTFFYPTYFTCFKKQKKLRLFFAIFMAAGVGNFLLHFLSETGYITNDGFFTHFRNFHVYWFHVTILSLGIYVSQNRNSGKKDAPRKGALPRAIASTGSMILFYIFLTVFDVSRANVPRGLSLYDHFRYLGAMFGVNY